jgi:transcriptional regulator with XRE-family HTH domain
MKELLLNLGKKILELRKEKRLTLHMMAQEIGMSPSLISQVERGVLKPSLETLIRISRFLEVSPAYLLDGPLVGMTHEDNFSILHSDERKALLTQGNIKFSLLSNKLDLGCEFILIEYPPHSSTGVRKYKHIGIECGFILEGELIAEIEDKVYRLNPGDSITYKSSSLHRTINKTSREVKAIWVHSEPFMFSAK